MRILLVVFRRGITYAAIEGILLKELVSYDRAATFQETHRIHVVTGIPDDRIHDWEKKVTQKAEVEFVQSLDLDVQTGRNIPIGHSPVV